MAFCKQSISDEIKKLQEIEKLSSVHDEDRFSDENLAGGGDFSWIVPGWSILWWCFDKGGGGGFVCCW